jgi:oxidoreductase
MFVWKSAVTVTVVSGAFLAAIAFLFQSPPQGAIRMDLIKQYRALNKTCFVLGASGESGKALIKELIRLKPFERVVLIGRRKLDYQDEELRKLVGRSPFSRFSLHLSVIPTTCNVFQEQRVIDFDKIEDHKAEFAGFNVGYCCLGTTRGKSGADVRHFILLSIG